MDDQHKKITGYPLRERKRRERATIHRSQGLERTSVPGWPGIPLFH